MGKIVNLPKPTDLLGNILTVEEVEELAQEPYYVPVMLDLNGRIVQVHVACDFDNIPREVKKDYDLFKIHQFKSYTTDAPKKKNSKYTVPKEEKEAQEESDDFDSYLKMVERSYGNQEVLLSIVFPPNHVERPVILGHDVPNMPDANDVDALKAWFEEGGATASNVLESIVCAYDPTSPLAISKKAREMSSRVMTEAVDSLEIPVENESQEDLESQPLSKTSSDGESATTETENPAITLLNRVIVAALDEPETEEAQTPSQREAEEFLEAHPEILVPSQKPKKPNTKEISSEQ